MNLFEGRLVRVVKRDVQDDSQELFDCDMPEPGPLNSATPYLDVLAKKKPDPVEVPE